MEATETIAKAPAPKKSGKIVLIAVLVLIAIAAVVFGVSRHKQAVFQAQCDEVVLAMQQGDAALAQDLVLAMEPADLEKAAPVFSEEFVYAVYDNIDASVLLNTTVYMEISQISEADIVAQKILDFTDLAAVLDPNGQDVSVQSAVAQLNQLITYWDTYKGDLVFFKALKETNQVMLDGISIRKDLQITGAAHADLVAPDVEAFQEQYGSLTLTDQYGNDDRIVNLEKSLQQFVRSTIDFYNGCILRDITILEDTSATLVACIEERLGHTQRGKELMTQMLEDSEFFADWDAEAARLKAQKEAANAAA